MLRDPGARLDLYRSSLINAWGCVDYNDWPIKLNAAFHLFLDEFGAEFLEDIEWLEREGGRSLEEIARAMGNPARIYRIIDTSLYGLRRRRVPLEQQRRTALKLLDMIKALKHGSEFNEDGINQILSPQQAEELAVRVPPASRERSIFVHRFCGVMWAYTESIFFRAHDVTKEIHGPYRLENGQRMVVKDYLNLRPHEIWTHSPLLPCDRIRIVKRYKPGIGLSVDALNHLFVDQGVNLVENLDGCQMEVDGRTVDEAEGSRLLDCMQETIAFNASAVDAMSWHQKVDRYAEIFWFRKRPVRDLRGLSWTVPDHIRARIATGSDNPARRDRLSPEQVCRLAKLTI